MKRKSHYPLLHASSSTSPRLIDGALIREEEVWCVEAGEGVLRRKCKESQRELHLTRLLDSLNTDQITWYKNESLHAQLPKKKDIATDLFFIHETMSYEVI